MLATTAGFLSQSTRDLLLVVDTVILAVIGVWRR